MASGTDVTKLMAFFEDLLKARGMAPMSSDERGRLRSLFSAVSAANSIGNIRESIFDENAIRTAIESGKDFNEIIEELTKKFDHILKTKKLIGDETEKTLAVDRALRDHEASIERILDNEARIKAGINKEDADRLNHTEKELELTRLRAKSEEEFDATLENQLEKERHKCELKAKYNKLQMDIDAGYIRENRNLDKQLEYRNIIEKKLREGLTLEEEKHRLYIKTFEKFSNTDMLTKGIDELKRGLRDLHDVAKTVANPWIAVDQAAANYTKRLGGTASALRDMRRNLIDVETARHIGSHYNVSMEELAAMQSNYGANIGRRIDFTNLQKETVAAIHNVAGENGQSIAQNLENYGFDIEKGGDFLTQMFNGASKRGLAFEKVAKNLQENIKMAQSYTFADGVRGLERMAERSAALKLNMQQTSAFADRVSTLEGALKTGAGLSVLGGAFARNSNPLAMLYEGLNDAEALQERTIRMIESMGHFDKTKGQLDVSAFNRMRIKAMAQQTGMDYTNLMESANAMGRRKEVEYQIRGMFGEDRELAELVKNTAQLDENGNAYVTVNGEKKGVKDITSADKSQLRISNNSQEDNIRSIAQDLRGTKEMIDGIAKQRDALYARLFENFGDDFKGAIKKVGDSNLYTVLATSIPLMIKSIESNVRMINFLLLMKNSFGNGAGTLGGTVVRGGGFGLGGNYGGKYAYTQSVNKRGITQFRGANGRYMSPPSQGMKFMNGVGKYGGVGGVGMGLAGAGIDAIASSAYDGERKDGWYGVGKMAGRALEVGGTAAAIGSMFGPWGTLIGGGLGLIGGAVWGGVEGFGEVNKDKVKGEIESATGFWLKGDYDMDELEAIRDRRIDGTLRSKMQGYGDVIPGYRRGGFVRRGYANGTNRVTGKGNATSDSIPAMLSVGEAVVSADNVRGNGMTISAINNGRKMDSRMMDIKKVAPVENVTKVSAPTSIKMAPLSINVSGTIRLEAPNGQSAEIDVNKLLRNQEFINEISKRISRQIEYGFRKEEAPNKYSFTHIK